VIVASEQLEQEAAELLLLAWVTEGLVQLGTERVEADGRRRTSH
jgi:hypothetical protein